MTTEADKTQVGQALRQQSSKPSFDKEVNAMGEILLNNLKKGAEEANAYEASARKVTAEEAAARRAQIAAIEARNRPKL